MVAHRTQIEADLVQACIPQTAAELTGQHGAVGIEPEVQIVAAALANCAQVGQGQIGRQERFATADADAAESQGGHIGGIIRGSGKRQTIGNRRSVIILCRGTVKAASVAASVDEQAGPAAVTAAPAAGRQAVAINLGSGVAETGAAIQPPQQFVPLCAGCSQLIRACKVQQLVTVPVLAAVGFDQLLSNAVAEMGLIME